MTIKKNQKTNILYILNSSSGGATQGIIELLSAIDRNSIEPFIITPNSPNKNQEKLFRKYSKEVEVIRMDWWNKKYDTRLTKRIIQSLSSILKTPLRSREDKIDDGKIREKILKNSPKNNEEFFVVPKVIE